MTMLLSCVDVDADSEVKDGGRNTARSGKKGGSGAVGVPEPPSGRTVQGRLTGAQQAATPTVTWKSSYLCCTKWDHDEYDGHSINILRLTSVEINTTLVLLSGS